MTGSLQVAIVTPIVALIGLACWLGLVFWAERHPGWKTHHAAQESQYPGEIGALAGDLGHDESALPQQKRQERKAA